MISSSRRDFIRLCAALGGATILGCGDDDDGGGASSSGGGGSDKEVVIVGGGLAGLTAAYELDKLGYAVTVLEGQERSGGRVFTMTDGFAEGLWAEGGAIRIPDVHQYTLGYVAEFGLEVVEFPPDNPINVLGDLRFQWSPSDGPEGWPAELALTAVEKQYGLGEGTAAAYFGAFFEKLGDPSAAGWPSGDAATFDPRSVAEHLADVGASEDFIRLYRAEHGTEIDSANALLWLALSNADRLTGGKLSAIKGGNGQLPQSLADKLGDKIKLGSKVKRVAQDASGVQVTYDDAGGEKTLTAAHAIVAVSPVIARTLDLGALSQAKTDALAKAQMMAASRVFLQTKTRFWKDENVTGLRVVRSDRPLERVWDVSAVMPGDKGLLMVYQQDQNARDIAARSDALAWIQEQVLGVLPAFEGQYDDATFEKHWSEDPWTGGGWSSPATGDAATLPAFGLAEGRIHFAGEHTSIWGGWMNGAIESGKRVAAEISATEGTTAWLRQRLPSRAGRRARV
jgi:monoamine oxidase